MGEEVSERMFDQHVFMTLGGSSLPRAFSEPLGRNVQVFLDRECGYKALRRFVSKRSGHQAEKCCRENHLDVHA